jgi:hypothetical protein
MNLRHVCLTTAFFCFVCATEAMAQQEEEGPDIRGDWVADIVPSTKDMFVTDCPCEDYTQMIEISCKPKSGVARLNLNDFITDESKAGDKITVTYDIDGNILTRDAVMSEFSGKEVRPGFEIELSDALFASIASGRELKLSHASKTATSPLRGSKKAMAAMMTYCGK